MVRIASAYEVLVRFAYAHTSGRYRLVWLVWKCPVPLPVAGWIIRTDLISYMVMLTGYLSFEEQLVGI